MLGVFAEFETNLGRERRLEGIAAAKRAVRWRGDACEPYVKKGRRLLELAKANRTAVSGVEWA